jgi:hypothetical protein
MYKRETQYLKMPKSPGEVSNTSVLNSDQGRRERESHGACSQFQHPGILVSRYPGIPQVRIQHSPPSLKRILSLGSQEDRMPGAKRNQLGTNTISQILNWNCYNVKINDCSQATSYITYMYIDTFWSKLIGLKFLNNSFTLLNLKGSSKKTKLQESPK